MIELIWITLNVLIFCFIVVKLFRLVITIRKKYGLIVAVICTFFLLSFVNKPNEKLLNTEKFNFRNVNNSDNELYKQQSSYSESKIIEKKLLTSLIFSVTYNKNGVNRENIILNNCYICTSGTICGTKFKILNITTNSIDKNIQEFNLTGELKWSLIGIGLYTQIKKYKVKLNLK